MQKKMRLKGRIRKEDGSFVFVSKMHDGTIFSLPADEHDVQLNDEFEEGVDAVSGCLFVVQEAQQDTRCSVTLPKPTLQYGRQVIISSFDLLPLNTSIESFNPKLVTSSK